ncbi:sulfite reductase (NADPH) hemoprotein beta-component [Cryptococcus neoformans AD2-60a]|nr:sulfite reductase (NADPH) hemoprotein beta-component [Cryptococcus neoformans var. grubii AD2-60a]OXC85610.1 sulfite reductase (NADPH) hemoprotein beta-component [Cryptococcus neoformans var. grubii AD1-7a]OXG85305.1 sulfite reductase (NADPH) hemoprotein beta-component [Cryptococcus neoformans var. grubii Br795]OXH35268.1 sulfite reductase (NADPH) hemoprotein beta-component [Cryptococcus neoformans var. grubii]
MPIDPDAYMAGAIPTLSRGGSWLQGERQLRDSTLPPSHFHEGSRCGSSPGSNYNPQTPPTPGRSQFGENPFLLPRSPFQRSLSISDCALPSIYSDGRPPPMPMLTHLQMDISEASSIHGLNRKQVFGPLQHHVWLKSSSEADQNSATSRSFDAQFLVSGARSVASSVSVPQNVRSIRSGQHSHHHFDKHLPLEQGRSWENHGGSPKPLAPEPDSGMKKSPCVKLDGHLRRTSDASNLPTPYRKLSNHRILPPVSSHDDYFPSSPTSNRHDEQLAITKHRYPHSSNFLPPKPRYKKLAEQGLSRSAQLNSRMARLSLAGRECRTPDPEPSSGGYPTGPHSPLRPSDDGKRPSIGRRHTASHVTESTHTPSSLPISPPIHKTLHQLKRTRHNSSPHAPTSESSSYNEQAASGFTVDFTTSPPTPPRSRTDSNPSTPVSKQFPHPNTDSPHKTALNSSVAPSERNGPAGYVSSLFDDPYDRYATHPNAPTPDGIEKLLSLSSSPSPSISKPPSTPLRPLQPKAPKDGDYIPPGFAKPTKNLSWNRDGPAMRTYGIAWKREGDPEKLPEGPEGPRWVQARPPRVDHVLGGSWWESGGEEDRISWLN